VEQGVGSWDLVERFFDASVSPERLDELLAIWDSQIADAGLDAPVSLADVAGSTFAHEVAGVFQILEQIQAAELQRVKDLLSGIHTAAMLLDDDGAVIAANEAAALAFGVREGGTVSNLPLAPDELRDFAERIAEVAADGSGEAVVRLRPQGVERVMMVHLRPMGGSGSRARVLAVTTERPWPRAVSALLARVFELTPAEIEVTRLLTVGGTVAAIARAGARSTGTVRSQLHAILEKTGAQSQAELLRLVMLLLESVPPDSRTRLVADAVPEPRQRFLRMPDGRRIEVLTFGDPAGRPVIWMQSTYGFFRLPRAAEAEMVRRGLRVLVPFRAGYCGSDPAPEGRNAFDVAIEDLHSAMRLLGIASAPIVAPADDIRIALLFARAEPQRVRHVFGIGAGFPILNDAQYRRLIPIARFVRACARYSPRVLPFMIRGIRMTIVRGGVERYLRGTLARIPADARAFADPEVGGALVEGVERMFFRDNWSEAAFCAEMVLFHRDWPPDLGQIACPVTLIHGEQDGNAPFETALEYCAMYPSWHYVGYPDDGELVAHVRHAEVLALVDQATARAIPPHR
jgi:pimeloyl-ACP methyl ester carboxylesterase/DNA-binding CsgD family transcriptional regulator